MKKSLLVSLLGVGLLAGCGTAARQMVTPAIGVSVSPSTMQTLDQGQSQSLPGKQPFTATVANDSGNKGVTWTATCSVADCGSFNPTSTASGVATTYTAPAMVSGTLTVTVTATSVSDTTKKSAPVMVVVSAPPQLPTTTAIQNALNTANPNPMTGTPFSFQFTLMAGNPGAGTITWAVGSGSLPAGLTLSTSGLLSGIPKITKPGQFRVGSVTSSTTSMFTVTATDSGNPPTVVASGMLTITISPSNITVTISSPTTPPTIQQGQTVSITATVANDPANQGVSWAVSCAVSACGSVNPTSTASGTPTTYRAPTPVTANLTVMVTATSVGDTSRSASIQVTVTPPPLTITTTSLPTGTTGVAYGPSGAGATLTATGGVTPFMWSWAAATGSSLPAGLNISTNTSNNTGLISGTPTTAGSFTVVVTVTDSESPTMSFSATFTIVISAPGALTITTTSLPNGTVGVSYSATVTATGGVTPYTWTGSSTCGLGVANSPTANEGLVSGSPTPAGSCTVTVTVTDSESAHMTFTTTFTITISSVTACTAGQTTLCGRFDFFFQGTDANGAVAMAGSFTADGTNVTGGVMDINRSGSLMKAATINPSPVSSFSFDTNKLGTLTLNTSAGTTTTFAIVLAPEGTSGRLIEFDGTTPATSTRGSGALGIPDSTAFNAAAITGNYALAFTGGDSLGHRVGMIGIFNANGSCTFSGSNASMTINVGGAPTTGLNFTGSCNSIDSTTGRGGATLSITGGSFTSPLNLSLYIFNAGKLFFMGTDPLDSGHPLLSGFVEIQKQATFNNASVTCAFAGNLPCVFAAVGSGDGTLAGASAASSVAVGLITVTSQTPSGAMTFTIDLNDGGTLLSNQTIPGFTYSVHPAGNGTIIPPPGTLRGNIDFVATDVNRAFFLSEGPEVNTGLLEPQLATSLASPPGEFAASTPSPPVRSYGTGVAFATLTGSTSGSVSGVADVNGGLPVSDATFTATYTIAANGRGSGSGNIPDSVNFVFYVIKGGRFVLIGEDVGFAGALIEFGHRGGDLPP